MIDTPLHPGKQFEKTNVQRSTEHDVFSSQVPNMMGLKLGRELPQMDQNNPKPEI